VTVVKQFVPLVFVIIGGWNVWTAFRFGYVGIGRCGTQYRRSDNPIAFWCGLTIGLACIILGLSIMIGWAFDL
jgi:hypothetical protein